MSKVSLGPGRRWHGPVIARSNAVRQQEFKEFISTVGYSAGDKLTVLCKRDSSVT
jgi:hypothetical protein